MTEIADLAQFFKALGDETRLQLVSLLRRQGQGHMLCVGRLADALQVTPSAVSQHLRVLKALGLVESDRVGQRIHYRLADTRLAHYRELARAELGPEFALSEHIFSETTQEVDGMCGEKENCCCKHPEGRQHDPSECTPEQIRECHGDAEEHACEQGQCCCEESG
jgi:DNA-binding transcriptional ArsR family regulator